MLSLTSPFLYRLYLWSKLLITNWFPCITVVVIIATAASRHIYWYCFGDGCPGEMWADIYFYFTREGLRNEKIKPEDEFWNSKQRSLCVHKVHTRILRNHGLCFLCLWLFYDFKWYRWTSLYICNDHALNLSYISYIILDNNHYY